MTLVNLKPAASQIGMVFQKPNPFPVSIYDNVAYGVRIAGHVEQEGAIDGESGSLKSAVSGMRQITE